VSLYDNEALFQGARERSSWDAAIVLLARLQAGGPEAGPSGEAARYFLADDIDDARRWCRDEIIARGLAPFSAQEVLAVSGRMAVAAYDYRGALEAFRAVYAEGGRLFARYDGLLSDLGRTFLYGGYHQEGTDLLLGWEKEAALSVADPPRDDVPRGLSARDFRYKCLYYAARMRRASGQRGEAAGLFARAVETAPDSLQRDACIWYIIEMGFAGDMETGIALIEKWAGVWHDGDYFADHYDRIAQWAVSTRRWQTLIQLFPAIEKGSSGLTRAKYAYIIARALEDGRAGPLERPPEAFFAIAYHENSVPYYSDEAFLYYRVMAGLKLGRQPDFIALPEKAAPLEITSREGRFLQGFFTHGASGYAAAWIRDYIETLPLDELRALCALLGGEALWGEAIRLGAVYMRRPDFVLTADDIRLYYPLGFDGLVSAFAQEFAIDEGILFGLIRTESSFIPDIVSRAAAAGLTQLMPDTALDIAAAIARQTGPDYAAGGAVDRTDPKTSIHIGAYFLRQLMRTQATPLNGILAYNGGPTRLRRWARASNLPPDLFMESIEFKETREYGKKVLGSAILYRYFYFSLKPEGLIADIMGN
jgi:soluble lytic murein transglycosylase